MIDQQQRPIMTTTTTRTIERRDMHVSLNSNNNKVRRLQIDPLRGYSSTNTINNRTSGIWKQKMSLIQQ